MDCRVIFPGLIALLLPAPVTACSICSGTVQGRQTLRQEAAQARLVLYGTLANARLNANGTGVTDLRIDQVLKDDPFRGNRKVVELPLPIAAADVHHKISQQLAAQRRMGHFGVELHAIDR